MDIRAERAYAKGQRIEELTQTSFKYTLPNNSFLSNGLYCAACRSFLPSSSVTPSEAYLCGCESVRWCSARCFDGCGWHKYSCKSKGSKLLAQFKAHCRKYNAMGENGAEIFFRLIFNASKVQGRLCPHLLAEEIEGFRRDIHSQEVIECAPRNDDIASIYSESYFLLKSVLLFDWRLDESLFDTHLTYDFWLLVLHALHYTFLPIYIEHPDIQRIQSIALLPDTILRHQAFVPYTNQAWMSAKASDPALVAAFTSQPDCPILKERLLVRLLQSLQASDEASNPYISMGYHGIGLPCTLLPHSCLPNTIIDQQTFWSQCDVEINEVLTMSRASVGGKSYEERCDVLRRTFGSSFDCSCSKCIFERSIDRNSFYTSICKDSPPLPIPFFADCPVDLLRTANDYMQNQHFIAVLNTCRLLIRLVSQVLPIATAGIDIGDVYFLMGAALLNMDRWKECQKVWYEGFHLKPGHAGLQREILKSRAYSLSPFHTPSPVLIPTRHCGHCIYQTTAPIVSASGCAEVIQTAESFACSEESSLGGGKGGWSTSRHYAVPTTDIALHRIPALLEWFQSLFASSIHPLLLQHFGGTSE